MFCRKKSPFLPKLKLKFFFRSDYFRDAHFFVGLKNADPNMGMTKKSMLLVILLLIIEPVRFSFLLY